MIPVTLTTHNGGLHADDVFACATLALVLEQEGRPYVVSRSRDPELMAQSDIVFDVGGVYDPARERFDHHQEGGAGKRDDDIPYAAFGLVWKKYGEQLCGSEGVARRIEKHIVEPIDAFDNGIDLFTPIKKDIWPFTMHTIVGTFNAVWDEDETVNDTNFLLVVDIAKQILKRTIIAARSNIEVEEAVRIAYESATRKDFLVFDKPYGRIPLQMALQNYHDVKIAVYPHITSSKWHATTLVDDINSFEARIQFPESWGGLRDHALQQVTGAPTAVFCHTARFLVVTETKDDILFLTETALQSLSH